MLLAAQRALPPSWLAGAVGGVSGRSAEVTTNGFIPWRQLFCARSSALGVLKSSGRRRALCTAARFSASSIRYTPCGRHGEPNRMVTAQIPPASVGKTARDSEARACPMALALATYQSSQLLLIRMPCSQQLSRQSRQ